METQTEEIRPLLFIPSPRDIPEVAESIGNLKIDKLWIKYHPQLEAYEHASIFFRNHDFTHLIIHPDDMLATQSELDQLIQDITEEPNRVIGGYCNVTAGSTDWEDANISYSLPPDPPHIGTYQDYHWIPLKDLAGKSEIIKVKHSGFGLLALPRDVITKIPFRTDSGCCPDSCLSLDLDKSGIDQYVDTRIYCKHIRTDPSILQVGKKEKEIRIITHLPRRNIRTTAEELRDRILTRISFLQDTMNDTPEDKIGPLKWLVEQLQDILV